MRRNLICAASACLSVAFIVIVVGSYVIVAQTTMSGVWTASMSSQKAKSGDTDSGWDTKDVEGKLHLELSEDRGPNHHNQFGTNFDFNELEGLTREQVQNGKVSFRIVREAGVVECEGTFVNGKGSGTYRFIPSAGYLDAMRSRGFDFEKETGKNGDGQSVEEKQFSAAMLNVTTALADDLKSSGFTNLGVEDLFKAAIFKVDSKFMAEMKATGFPNMNMEDLVKARIFKIDADYVRQVHDMGFVGKDFEGLVKFRIFKVTPEFLTELKGLGFNNLSSEEVVKFRIFNIDADFIRKAQASEPSITVEQMVQMKIGVRKMKGTD